VLLVAVDTCLFKPSIRLVPSNHSIIWFI